MKRAIPISIGLSLIFGWIMMAAHERFSTHGNQPLSSMQAFVANTGADTVSVIDLSTGATMGSPIRVGPAPSALTVSPDQQYIYVANAEANTVSVIDAQSRTVVATIELGKTSVRVSGLVMQPDGRRLFITSPRGNTVYTANTSTNAEDDLFPVSGRPAGLVWTMKAGPFIYISTPQDQGITSVDLFETRRSRQVIKTGPNPFGLALSPNGDMVYVADIDDPQVSVVSTISSSVERAFHLGNGSDSLALTPDGERLIVAHLAAPTASILNPALGPLMAKVSTGSSSMTQRPGLNRVAVSPDGLVAMVANEDDDTVSLIDLKTNSGRGVVPVGNQPTGVIIVGKAAVCDPTPNAFNFGDVPIGTGGVEQVLFITNRGTDMLRILRATIDNTAFQIESMPRSLAPRETVRFLVRFTPTTFTAQVGTLVFETNDPDPDRCQVSLRGVGRAPVR